MVVKLTRSRCKSSQKVSSYKYDSIWLFDQLNIVAVSWNLDLVWNFCATPPKLQLRAARDPKLGFNPTERAAGKNLSKADIFSNSNLNRTKTTELQSLSNFHFHFTICRFDWRFADWLSSCTIPSPLLLRFTFHPLPSLLVLGFGVYSTVSAHQKPEGFSPQKIKTKNLKLFPRANKRTKPVRWRQFDFFMCIFHQIVNFRRTVLISVSSLDF